VSGLEFTESVIKSLAWPITALTIALMFRSAIRSTITGKLKRMKAGPGGIEFEYWKEAIEIAKGQLPTPPELSTPPDQHTGLQPDRQNELEALAQVSPRAAVLEAFIRVEAEVRQLTQGLIPDEDKVKRMGIRQLVLLGNERGIINAQTLSAINGLSVLRNMAAHGTEELELSRALEFIHLAEAVLYSLRNQPRLRP